MKQKFDIVFVEDEDSQNVLYSDDLGITKKYHRVNTLEEVIKLLENERQISLNSKWILVADLYVYSGPNKEQPYLFKDQLLANPFSVRSGIDEKYVIGRIGVLSELVRMLEEMTDDKKPSLIILFTQVYDYLRLYNTGAKEYSYFTVSSRTSLIPGSISLGMVPVTVSDTTYGEDRNNHQLARHSDSNEELVKKYKKVMNGIRDAIEERMQSIKDLSEKIGVKFIIIEKPYNFFNADGIKEDVRNDIISKRTEIAKRKLCDIINMH